MQLGTGRFRLVVLSALIVLMAASAFSFKRKGKEMTLETLTRNSDSVVIGKCKAKNVHWVGKSLETDYEVEVQEQLKGKAHPAGKVVAVTVPGGELTTPPLTQMVEYTPRMVVGEEVALFLKDTPPAGRERVKARIDPKSKLWNAPYIYGWFEGKFSVITDKRDGKRKITRINLENYGVVPQDRTLDRVLKAVASGELNSFPGQVVELGGGLYTTPEGKQVLDRAMRGQAETAEPAATPAALKPAPKNGMPDIGGVAVQDLDEFKAQVRKFAE